MRIDHHAYQRATGVAAAGLFAQLAVALLLLVFGKSTGDSTAVIASAWAFSGLVVWLGLILLFHQQRLERLESLEMDTGARLDEDGRLFTQDEARVARKRLGLMHSVLMPALSVMYALLLVGFAAGVLWWFGKAADPNADYGTFTVTSAAGWQLAVAFGTALLSFIFSRFLAGMAVQPAWANLRGGAGVMVGNALVSLAVGVGTVFELLRDDKQSISIMEGIAYGVAIFMMAVAAETLLAFLLNLYRPRRAGETPRPAFDSRLLSLLAAPDSIVRSINEAVNYQFGFDITSSWGYQLLIRSTAWLLALGVGVLVLLSCFVVVPPGQQAVRLRGGAIVGDVYEGTVMLKWPWPIETSAVVDVARIRTLVLGAKPAKVGRVNLWSEDTYRDPDRYPYLVSALALSDQVQKGLRGRAESDARADAGADAVTQRFALVDADIVMSYRIARNGLLDWLAFSTDARVRRTASDMRERILRDIALREATRWLSTQPMDAVLSPRGDSLVRALRERVQAAFDAAKTGVEVVAIQVPTLRPPNGDGAGMFEEISIKMHNGRAIREEVDRTVRASMAALAGSPERAALVAAAVTEYEKAERASGEDSAEAKERRAAAEKLILEGQGAASGVMSAARARRWQIVMGAAADSAQVLGQAPSFHAAPDLYKEFRTMQVLGRALSAARVKYVLGEQVAERANVDMTMKQAESGLNLADYLEKKDKPQSGSK
jgi:regulator of protease activity HflC (stomatin/prohibitin superfamily)